MIRHLCNCFVCRVAAPAILAAVVSLFAIPAQAIIGVCVANCSLPPPPPPPPQPHYYGGGGGGYNPGPQVDPRRAESVRLNNEGVVYNNALQFEAAIAKFSQALRVDPTNIQARSNLANSRSRLAEKNGDYDRALAYVKEACRLNAVYCRGVAYVESFKLNQEAIDAVKAGDLETAVSLLQRALRLNPQYRTGRANLAHVLSDMALKRSDLALALTKIEEANEIVPTAARQNQIAFIHKLQENQRQQAKKLSEVVNAAPSLSSSPPPPGAPTDTNSAPSPAAKSPAPVIYPAIAPAGLGLQSAPCPFDKCGNPKDTGIDKNKSGTSPNSNKSAAEQAGGIKKDIAAVTPGTSDEAAHHQASCGLDGQGDCQTGPALPHITPGAKPTTKSAVFPGLTDEKWQKLQNSEDGRDLIKQADELLQQQGKLNDTIRKIRFSADAGSRQQELISFIDAADEVNKKIDGLQNQAEKIIEKTTLDP
jgi:tetratricopeptide (TPR) repeat protein